MTETVAADSLALASGNDFCAHGVTQVNELGQFGRGVTSGVVWSESDLDHTLAPGKVDDGLLDLVELSLCVGHQRDTCIRTRRVAVFLIG
ncbi:hypothetical protein D9M69_561890 [compost metagenome]